MLVIRPSFSSNAQEGQRNVCECRRLASLRFITRLSVIVNREIHLSCAGATAHHGS